MFALRTVWKTALALALLVPLAALTACGGGQKVIHDSAQAGNMPTGADWTGVYYSQIYGYLHLIKTGNHIKGAWRTTEGDTWGTVDGDVTGNLFRFKWENHKIGMVGAAAHHTGHGYFVYTRPHAGEADELHGGWGLGKSDAGNPWDCVKQTGMKPDLKSVMPDELERRGEGGGWDQSTAAPANSGGNPVPPPGGGAAGSSDDNGGLPPLQ